MRGLTLYETVSSSNTPVVTQNCPIQTLTSFSSIVKQGRAPFLDVRQFAWSNPTSREGEREPSVVRDTSGLLDMEAATSVNIENIENDEIDSFSDGGDAGCHSAASLGN